VLFMVIERFRENAIDLIHDRFVKMGRMLPEGVVYIESWIADDTTLCYQLMESPKVELVTQWTTHWSDLADFEIRAVQTSADFWTRRQ